MYNFSVPSKRLKRLEISRFDGGMSDSVSDNILPVRFAKKLYNIESSNGGLLPGVGLDYVSIEQLSEQKQELLLRRLGELSNPTKMAHFVRHTEGGARGDYLLFLCGNQIVAVNVYEPENANQIVWSEFLGEPVFLNYNLNGNDVVIISSTETKMVVWDGVSHAYAVVDAPDISSMALHYERLFATSSGEDQNTVWFSDDLDPTNWSVSLLEAGFIKMVDERGSSQKVISFLDYVYVFREYGISRISGYGDQTQFLVSQLSTQTGKIFPSSVTLLGNQILFLAEDGAYAFDGLSTRKIMPEMDGFLFGADNKNSRAVASGGKWYVLCNIIVDGQSLPVLLCYDTRTKKCVVGNNLGICDLCALRLESGSKILAIANVLGTKKVLELNRSGKILTQPLTGLWQSAWQDLGEPSVQKTIRQASLLKGANCKPTLTIESDNGETATILFSRSRKTDSGLANILGTRFRFTLEFANVSLCDVESFVVEYK